MHLIELRIENLGPIENAVIVARFDPNGHPLPIVLVGQNGSGKSLALACLLDAIIEARKKIWQSIPEVAQDKLLRILNKRYIHVGTDFSKVLAKFRSDQVEMKFYELTAVGTAAEFNQKYPNYTIDGILPNSNPMFVEFGMCKDVHLPMPTGKDVLAKSVFVYLPYFRYDRPAWLSEESRLKFNFGETHAGMTENSVVQLDLVSLTSQWLLDLVLDREVNERIIVNMPVGSTISMPGVTPSQASVPVFAGYQGNNARAIDHVQQILLEILRARDPKITAARIGVGRKIGRHIAVFVTRDGNESVYAPTLPQLSSGELMVLSLFSSIVRSYDQINGIPPEKLEDIRGIVLVDEIDLHLHIGLQKIVLPRIITMFPNVQFIVTTHSPFFLLGLSEGGAVETDIISLPTATKISPDEFVEFRAGYDTFVAENERFMLGYQNLAQQLKSASKPLVVTEGKTDWKHLKSALLRLQSTGLYVNLDIEFLEYEDDVEMGDTRLASTCENTASLPNSPLLSGQKVNNSNWLLSSRSSNRSGVPKIADWIGIFSNTVTEKTCSNV